MIDLNTVTRWGRPSRHLQRLDTKGVGVVVTTIVLYTEDKRIVTKDYYFVKKSPQWEVIPETKELLLQASKHIEGATKGILDLLPADTMMDYMGASQFLYTVKEDILFVAKCPDNENGLGADTLRNEMMSEITTLVVLPSNSDIGNIKKHKVTPELIDRVSLMCEFWEMEQIDE